MIERLYPVPEAALVLHCSPSQLLALIRKGRLRALKHCRPYLIPESEIERFIKEELDRCNRAGSSGADQTVATTPAVMISADARSSATRSALATLNGQRSHSIATSPSMAR